MPVVHDGCVKVTLWIAGFPTAPCNMHDDDMPQCLAALLFKNAVRMLRARGCVAIAAIQSFDSMAL
jgi:hypothetical protein